MLNRKPKTFAEMAQNWGRLTESVIRKPTPSAAHGKAGLLIESHRGVDHNYYGIIQENDGYYVKVASGSQGVPGVDDYRYIGGEPNRHREGFASLPKAQHRVNLKLFTLHEGVIPQAGGSVDDLLQQLQQVPAEAPAPAPLPEPAFAAPVPGAAPEGTPAPAEVAPGELPADPVANPLAAAPEGGPAEGGDDITSDELLSQVGKLGADIDKLGASNLTPQLTKAIVKPVLTHLEPGLNAMEPKDRQEIASQVEGEGEAAPVEGAPAPEAPQPLQEETGPSSGQLQSDIHKTEEELANWEGGAGSGGRFHKERTREDLIKAKEDAEHALKMHDWETKKPKHPSEALHEGYNGNYGGDDDLGENPEDSEFGDGFRQFCQYRGYDPNVDDELFHAVQQWAKVVSRKSSPYNPDIAGVADSLNPAVWDEVKGTLPPSFAKLVQDEQLAVPQEALNENLQAVLRELVREQVEHLRS